MGLEELPDFALEPTVQRGEEARWRVLQQRANCGLPIDLQPDALGVRHTYDVTSTAQPFIVRRPASVDPAPAIAVIVNWQTQARKQAD